MRVVRVLFSSLLFAVCIGDLHAQESPSTGNAGAASGLFVLRSTDRPPEAVVEAIRAYAQARQWPFLGADAVKQGEVTLVKLCIPEVGKQLWSVGLHLSAMLPCGNVGVYRKAGRTEVSLLHPRYMQLLDPDPAVAKASAIAGPLLIAMLDQVAPQSGVDATQAATDAP